MITTSSHWTTILFRALVILLGGLPIARRTVAQTAAPPAERPIDAALIDRAARRIEPELQGDPGRLEQYLDGFRRELADDPRLVACEVVPEAVGDDGVRITGWVEYPETRAALGEFFAALGFDAVDNQVETLPDADLGDKQFGFINVPHTLSLEEPDESATVGTDCVLGEPLFLLREVNGFLHVHASDGYLGYVRADYVHRVDEDEFAGYQDGRVAVLQSDHQQADGSMLPAGARLKWIRSTADGIIVELPTGEEASLPNAITQVRDQPKSQIDHVLVTAKQLLGTPYLWGGKTSAGVDCSGLVQVSFAAGGVSVPRDANQQFHVGRLTGTRWCRATMRRGDTMYFIGAEGRVRHTGIYLGDDKYIHAGSPVVGINSLNPEDDEYDERRAVAWAWARRVWD